MELWLLSLSCTTGWADLGHGELWLTPDTVVRIPRTELTRAAAMVGYNAAHTLATARIPVDDDDPLGAVPLNATEPVTVDPAVWRRYVESFAHRRRLVVLPLAQITRAKLRRGMLTTSLRTWHHDGSRQKLLFLSSSHVSNSHVRSRLETALGGRLV